MSEQLEARLIELSDALAQEALRPITDLTKSVMARLAREVLQLTAQPPAPLTILTTRR